MNRPALLKTMIATPWGHYSPGLQVTILEHDGDRAKVCLDNHYHPTGTCHFAGVPTNQLYIPTERLAAA
ncbi:hypothetical protein ACIGKR_12290 [Rhodococcus qingshengii]|uniref:hypothetical protein n=1 Tax=Rhodococcus qingshengii TaxID=334542 RepID=UPI0037CAB81E